MQHASAVVGEKIETGVAMSAHDSLFSGPGVRVAPRYARHVGRVGALAVALGVGAAFASMPTASADSTLADSTTSAGSTAADSPSASGPSLSNHASARGVRSQTYR